MPLIACKSCGKSEIAPTALSLIDAPSAIALRVALLSRMDLIDQLYPEVGSADRVAAIMALVHLTSELGLDTNELFFPEDSAEVA